MYLYYGDKPQDIENYIFNITRFNQEVFTIWLWPEIDKTKNIPVDHEQLIWNLAYKIKERKNLVIATTHSLVVLTIIKMLRDGYLLDNELLAYWVKSDNEGCEHAPLSATRATLLQWIETKSDRTQKKISSILETICEQYLVH